MAVLSGATASGRQFYAGQLNATSGTAIYTAPTNNTNVTSPSSTAYIKEIIMCNATGSPMQVWITTHSGNPLVFGLTVNANDTKVLSGLNTMLPAGADIEAWASSATGMWLTISGQEVQ